MTAAPDLRLVVFDMDGTLIDSQHLIVDAMHGAFGLAGHPLPTRDEILAIVGLSLEEAVAALAPALPVTETRRLADHYREGFVAQRAAGSGAEQAPLYPGARAALERLSSDPATLLGIATGKARRGLDHSFEIHGIGDFFCTLQTADFASVEAASVDAPGRSRRDRRRGAACRHGRRYRVRHRHGPRRRFRHRRGRLGLPPPQPAGSRRRRRRH